LPARNSEDRCCESDISNFARWSFLQIEFLLRRNFARNNKFGLRNLNDVAALVYRPAEENYRAAIRSWAGWRNFNDFALNMEYVSGPGRCRPAQLCPGADETAGEWRTALDIQTHRDRGGVPTARRQALEERMRSGMRIRVKGLRIELKCECRDLRFVKPVRPAGKALSDMKIVKVSCSGAVLAAASLITWTMVMSTSSALMLVTAISGWFAR
jgi:hypothetical protein